MVAVGVLLLQGVDPAGQPREEFGEDGARVRVRRLPVRMQGVWRPVKNPHAGEQDAHVRRGEDEEQGPDVCHAAWRSGSTGGCPTPFGHCPQRHRARDVERGAANSKQASMPRSRPSSVKPDRVVFDISEPLGRSIPRVR